MITLLLFILVLSLLVFVHEFGHFIVAKRVGMKVEEFGFGFPPRLWGIKRGGTLYSVNWIPIGGFVKIKGESGAHADDPDSLASKKAWQRFFVFVAGVVMNLVLAAVLFSIGYMIGLPSVIDETLPKNARVREEVITIMQVVEGSPAADAGIVAGDEIVSVGREVFASDSSVRAYMAEHASDGIEVMVQGVDGTQRTYTLTSEYLEKAKITGVGIAFASTGFVSYPFFQAIVQGLWTTGQLTMDVVRAFYGLLRDFIMNQQVAMDFSGPIGIAVMTGQVAAMGFIYLLQFTAILSVNLAVINLIPFPALDGGHVLFLVIEKLRGRAVNQKIEFAIQFFGFTLLMMFVVWVTYKDLVTLL